MPKVGTMVIGNRCRTIYEGPNGGHYYNTRGRKQYVNWRRRPSKSSKSSRTSKVSRSKSSSKCKSRSVRSSSGNLKVQRLSNQTNLYKHARKRKNMRVGATFEDRITQRASEYRRLGYTGTMYFAKTANMVAAEDKLLRLHPGSHNVQTQSNHHAAGPGYIYVIIGSKH
eukprot:377435_1